VKCDENFELTLLDISEADALWECTAEGEWKSKSACIGESSANEILISTKYKTLGLD